MTKKNDSDVAFIQALAEMLTANDLTELEVMREYADNDSLNVRVSRQLPVQQVVQSVAATAPVAAAAPAATTAPAQAQAVADPSNDPNAVPSPMVGTAYLSAEPGAAAFVKIGDAVTEGQTLMIIEAMKTMNHIPAPKSGTVKRVLVDDGTPVEFGAPLMIIE